MKKVFSAILACVMFASMSTAVMAAEEINTVKDTLYEKMMYVQENYNVNYEDVDQWSHYSDASNKRLQDAFDNAKLVYASEDSTEEQLQQAYININEALDQMYVNPKWVAEEYALASFEKNDNNWYSEELWSEFQSVMADTKEAIKNGDESVMNTQYYELRRVFNKLCTSYTVIGDINKSGKVDIGDATLLQKYLSGNIELNSSQKMIIKYMTMDAYSVRISLTYKVNTVYFFSATPSIDINISDATLIQKYSAMIETNLPYDASNAFTNDITVRNPFIEPDHVIKK